jgi:digeranylgeranylglycerophospholipid reductase
LTDIFDAIVVGAGPAGSMAAETVASAGHRVLLLERNRTVGAPVRCAEAVTTRALRGFVEPDDKWIAAEVRGGILFCPTGRRVTLEYPGVGYVLERKVFDRELALNACRAGAELRVTSQAVGLEYCGDDDVAVRVKENGRLTQYRSKVVVGADGIASSVGRWAGIDTSVSPRLMAPCAQRLVHSEEIHPGYLEFHFDRGISPGGYAWVFPKGENTANVGLAAFATGNNRCSAVNCLDDFLNRRFEKFEVLAEFAGGIAGYNSKTVLQKGRVLLVGDAGRLADPLTYAGIGNALASGRIAGEVINAFLEGDGGLSEYPRRWSEWKSKDRRLYRFCHDLYAKMDNDDFEKIMAVVEKMFAGKIVSEFNKFEVVKQIILGNPRLLLLVGKKLWW